MSSFSFSSSVFKRLLKESQMESSSNDQDVGSTVAKGKGATGSSSHDIWSEAPDGHISSPSLVSASSDGIAFAHSGSGSSSTFATPRDGSITGIPTARASPRPPAKAPTAQSVAHLSHHSSHSPASSTLSSPANSRPSTPPKSLSRAYTSPALLEKPPSTEAGKNPFSTFSFDEDVGSVGSHGSRRSSHSISNTSRSAPSTPPLSRTPSGTLFPNSSRSASSTPPLSRTASGNLRNLDNNHAAVRGLTELGLSTDVAEDWAKVLRACGESDTETVLQNSARDREEKILFFGLLQSIGLKTVSVEGDGNCLFRAICYVIYGTDEHHAMIRYYICLYIRKRARKCFGTAHAPPPAVLDAYLNKMCMDREWGDEIAVRAAGYLYERPVKVFISDGEGGIAVHPQFPGNINSNSNEAGYATNEILLANYSGVTHFDALVTSYPALWRLNTVMGVYEESRLN
jgi:hypothetical protein